MANQHPDRKDIDIVRRLAGELADVADLECQAEKVEGWKRINRLQPHRPMLWITEIPWGEFENQIEELTPLCQGDKLRAVETSLRRRLFVARHLPCDEVVEATYYVAQPIQGLGYGVEVRERQLELAGGTYVKSHHYEAAIKEPEDIGKIKMPQITCDPEEAMREKEFFERLFGDILKVELQGVRQHFFNAWDELVRWTGVTEALMDLSMRPEFIHAIMRRMTDSMLERMRQLEEMNLLDYPHPLPRVGSGGAGYTDELPQPDSDPQHIRTLDQWGGATAQIFGEVSPDMHHEFALQYENEIMERCGLNYYGCCEPLHNKMHLMDKVPRLRKISVSPWCDVAKTVAGTRKKYVFSHKPSPAIFAGDRFNVESAEKDLRDRIKSSGDMPCEFIMKDISTVRGDVERLKAWCEMASRVIHSINQ